MTQVIAFPRREQNTVDMQAAAKVAEAEQYARVVKSIDSLFEQIAKTQTAIDRFTASPETGSQNI